MKEPNDDIAFKTAWVHIFDWRSATIIQAFRDFGTILGELRETEKNISQYCRYLSRDSNENLLNMSVTTVSKLSEKRLYNLLIRDKINDIKVTFIVIMIHHPVEYRKRINSKAMNIKLR